MQISEGRLDGPIPTSRYLYTTWPVFFWENELWFSLVITMLGVIWQISNGSVADLIPTCRYFWCGVFTVNL